MFKLLLFVLTTSIYSSKAGSSSSEEDFSDIYGHTVILVNDADPVTYEEAVTDIIVKDRHVLAYKYRLVGSVNDDDVIYVPVKRYRRGPYGGSQGVHTSSRNGYGRH